MKSLKKEIIAIQNILFRYKNIIPDNQKGRFDKDIGIIFANIEKTNDENDLKKINKLANTKLKSIQRIYGKLREESKEDKKEIINTDIEEYLINTFKLTDEEINFDKPRVNKFDELKKSPAFDADYVKRYQDEYFKKKEMIYDAFKIAQEQKQDKKNKNISFIAQDKNLDLNKYRNKDGEVLKDKLKEGVKEIMKNNNFPNYEKLAENMDYDVLIDELNNKNNEEVNYDPHEIKSKDEKKSFDSENIGFADLTNTQELFKQTNKNQKIISEKDMEPVYESIKKILDNKSTTMEEKRRLIKNEIKKADSEWNQKNMDGELKMNMYGEVMIDFYKDKEDGEECLKDQESNKSQMGVKTYVWRDGKLVEGKAKERKTVSYSNWHGGHLNPDDLRKHRELLDRQHYGGPLWEGIKYRSIIEDSSKLIYQGPDQETLDKLEETPPDLPKNPKHEIVEITR